MYIKKLTLQNFRKFADLELKLDKDINLLIGPNGSGKSSCIEAVSLITNGRSPFTSDMGDMLQIGADFFKVEAEFDDKSVKSVIWSIDKSGSGRASYLYNGKKKGLAKFGSYVKSNLFSPEHIDILMLSPSSRRDFIDAIISNIDYEYGLQLSVFSKTLRQRNRLLRKLAEAFYKDGFIDEENMELAVWTEKLAEASSTIIFKRTNFVTEINSVLQKDAEKGRETVANISYHSSLGLGDFEDMLDQSSLVKKHKEIYEKNRRKEIARGHSLYGAHRDDWKLIGFDKNIHRYGSRGEKRYVIGSFILSLQEVYKNMLGQFPILILDDLASELDKGRIASLIEGDLLGRQQVFVSSIEEVDGLEGKRVLVDN